jgi:ankyrin repeat protein
MKQSTVRNLSNPILIAAFAFMIALWAGCATVPSGSPLHAAIEQGRLDQASELIKKQKSLDLRDANGNTALHIAAIKGHTNLTEQLINAGAPLNLDNGAGGTPLYVAAAAGHAGIVRLLIDRGAALDAPANKLITPLGIAAANGHLDVVQFLAAKGASIESRTSDGLTPLLLAAWRGQASVVEFLLVRGASPNEAARDGFTALMEASRWPSNNMAKMLIERGADVNTGTSQGVTALMLAARHGNLNLAQLLIQRGASVNATNVNGETALYIAAFNGQGNVVPTLCDEGADLNHRAINGRSALHAAALRRDGDQLEYLIRKGAQPHALDAGLENSYATALAFQYHAWFLIEQTNSLGAREACARAGALFDKAGKGYDEVAGQLGKQVRNQRWMMALGVLAGGLGEGLSTVGAQYQQRQFAQISALRHASDTGTGHAGYFQAMSAYKPSSVPSPSGAGAVGAAAASEYGESAANMGSGRKIMETRAKYCREAAASCKATVACLDNKSSNPGEMRACLEAAPKTDAEMKFRKRRALSEIFKTRQPDSAL